MRRLLLLIIALILYGSLYPWEFHYHPLTDSIPHILMRTWPDDVSRWAAADLVINILLYMPLGAAAFLASVRRLGSPAAALFGVLLGFGLSTGIELAQIFDLTRFASAFDILSNTAGAVLGVFLAWAFGPLIRTVLARRHSEWKSAPGAFLLLVLWVVVQWYPLYPSLSRHTVYVKLRTLAGSHVTLMGMLAETTAWLAAAVLVEILFGQKLARRRFPFLLLLVPARFIIAGPGPDLTGLLSPIAALALWSVLPYQPVPRYRLCAAVIVGAMVIRGLAPFHFARGGAPFSWIPFRASLESSLEGGALIFIRKAFDYGAAVRLVRLTGPSYATAAAAVAALLACIEFAQLWLPGRVPESTDPLLAMMMAVILHWLEKDSTGLR